MNYLQIWLILGAAFCSALCWRVWPLERRRMVTGWVFIVLSVALQIEAAQLGTLWSRELANAFLQVAAIQFLAMILFQSLVRRRAVHMILSDLVVNLSYVAVVFRLLSRLGTDVNGLIATSTVVTAIVGL